MWLTGLLALSGDVETNPGPTTQTWTCDMCSTEITRRQTSYRCNSSPSHWVHEHCTTLRRNTDYTPTWKCNIHNQQNNTITDQHHQLTDNNNMQQNLNINQPHSINNNKIQQQINSKKTITIIQININGLTTKIHELKNLTDNTKIDIITIQETKLKPTHRTPYLKDYTAIRTDRTYKNGGGLMTYIKNDIIFTELKTPHTTNHKLTELQHIKIHLANHKHLNIFNIYIPPRDTTNPDHSNSQEDITNCMMHILCRPVSNLCFIAKILEKLVLSQVSSYLNSHNLYNTCQSAYRPGHSSETALLKVVNDLFLSLNKGNISVLALLDFSSAFDTIDHTILVHRLHTDFGFTDTVLQWFSSYLTDRTQYVSLCNHCSDFAPVHSGVPQGSVLGPMLFTMYIKPLSAIIDSHSIIHHSFADDLQLQMSAPPDRISELLHSMQSCISDVKAWATANMLKLNDSKTELMLVTSKRSKHLHNLPTSITIGNAQIPFKQSVKNLGYTLDCHLTMNAHVSNIARTCYYELRRLASIRRFLTSTATATLVSAFALSRIDYCNSLLFGSTNDVTSHLQRIQNYAARVIFRLPMSSSITIHLKSLHWLPVKVKSTYKIACLCYHCHSSTAPSYVTDMLHKKPLHTRNTRSSSYTMPLLNRPAHSKATLGDRSFSFASSSVWNSIPNDVRCAPSLSSLKSRLKTYLFRSVYID